MLHTTLIKVGNSQGVRLPKAVIEQVGLKKDLDLSVENGAVVIRPARRTREGWLDAAVECRNAGADRLDDWDIAVDDFAGDWT